MGHDIFKGFLSVMAGNVGRIIITALFTPIIVRILTNHQYGDYAFVLALIGPLFVLVSAGLNDGLRKNIKRYEEESFEDKLFSFYFRTATTIFIILLVIFGGAVTTGVINKTFGEAFEVYFAMMVAILISREMFALLRSVLMAKGEENYAEIYNTIQQFVFSAVAIVLAYVGFGVTGVLSGRVIGYLFGIVSISSKVREHINFSSVISPPSIDLPRVQLLADNSLLMLHALLASTLWQVDLIFVRIFVSSEATSHYKAALVLSQFIWVVPFAAQTVLIYSVSDMWNDNDIDAIQNLLAQATRYTALFTSLLAIGLGLLANAFVPLYFGSGYAPAITPLLLLLPGVVSYSTARPIIGTELSKESPRLTVIMTACAALLNIPLNYFLIQQYQISGAAIATSISYTVMLALHIWSSHLYGISFLENVRVLRVFGALFGTSVFLWVIKESLPEGLPQLIIIPPAGLIICLAIALALGAIRVEEVKTLIQS